MAKQNEHGKLIAAAAKAALSPLGCRRIGQSRTWISDQGAWVIMIEFQPSAWEKGTYLNVWPIWLWLRMGAGDFRGKRVGDYIPFESAAQFAAEVNNLARLAAYRVNELHLRFRTLAGTLEEMLGGITENPFRVYAAAATAAIVEDTVTARQLFDQIEALSAGDYKPWIELKAEAAVLAALLGYPDRYRAAASTAIDEARTRLRLPPYPQCLEAMDAITA